MKTSLFCPQILYISYTLLKVINHSLHSLYIKGVKKEVNVNLLVGWLSLMNNFSFASGATVSAAWQRRMHDLLQMSIIAISYLVVSNWWRGKHSINHCNVQHRGFPLEDNQFFSGPSNFEQIFLISL